MTTQGNSKDALNKPALMRPKRVGAGGEIVEPNNCYHQRLERIPKELKQGDYYCTNCMDSFNVTNRGVKA